jgi:glycosyltransferase involved in cell wall biosynthesis
MSVIMPMRGQADVCLLLEGTYPYILGGVSSWVHDLIRAQKHLKFALVSITPHAKPIKTNFEIPENVVYWSRIPLDAIAPGVARIRGAQDLPQRLAPALAALFDKGGLAELAGVLRILAPVKSQAGAQVLLNAPEAWNTLIDMYRRGFDHASFIDYFWTWRALLTSFYATVLADLPPAKCYHAISTGYAGILAARAAIETGRPALLTEHGIYTNERRIEITLADWLHDPGSVSLGAEVRLKGLKALWIGAFGAYARAAYEACDAITTLYAGNQDMQRRDGAPEDRLQIVPNGVDAARFGALPRAPRKQGYTVALIGRVVPIKDIKTFIRAIALLRDWMPDVRALIVGPNEEDPEYAAECRALHAHLGLGDNLVFTGRKKLDDILPEIDVNVLTSVSEAQPLVVLEAGAAGIPSVATDVGCCRDLILGQPGENPAFGVGGAIVPVASPMAAATAIRDLLADPTRLAQAGAAMRARVNARYNKPDIDRQYAALYHGAIARRDEPKLLGAA